MPAKNSAISLILIHKGHEALFPPDLCLKKLSVMQYLLPGLQDSQVTWICYELAANLHEPYKSPGDKWTCGEPGSHVNGLILSRHAARWR